MIVIESNYKSLGRVFNLKSLANKERKINWGVRVNIDGEKIKIEDVINTNLSNISNMYESDKIRIIHELLGKYVMRLKKHNVKLIYQINLSQTYRTMKKNNEYDEYTQVIFTMILKGFIDNHCIISTLFLTI